MNLRKPFGREAAKKQRVTRLDFDSHLRRANGKAFSMPGFLWM
jgi:hypothetical protein